MNLKKIKFEEKELRELAENYFMNAGGFDSTKSKHRRMIDRAMAVREECFFGHTINSHIKILDKCTFQSGEIVLDGGKITGNCLRNISDQNVLMMYVYIITVGHVEYEQYDSIVDQLHADMWGTAYVDAGRDMLEKYISEEVNKKFPGKLNESIYLSQGLSPGFYGIPPQSSVPIKVITKAEQLGIDVRENGVMIPIKTCSGIHMVVNDKNELPKMSCVNCIGNTKSCMLCRMRNEDMEVRI